MVYLIGLIIVATTCGRWVSAASSVLSVAAFDFFCVPPYLTFIVAEFQYTLTLIGMLAVAIVISTQAARLRDHTRDASGREARADALYRLSRNLAAQSGVFETARAAAALAEEVFGTRVLIFLPEGDRISFQKRTSEQLPLPRSEETVAQRALDEGRRAGHRTEVHPNASALYLPMRGTRASFGVLAVLPDAQGRIFSPEQQQMLDVFATQTALAMERTLSRRSEEESRFHMQTEQMRSSLLSAVSHDLRTPLASITGAASTLRSQGERLPPETRDELLESISEETERLSRLVGNLLDMTRFESGNVDLRRDFYPLEEIVGAALHRMERQLAGRSVHTELSETLPMLFVDDVLIGQVLWNLLDNAVKYTPAGTPIEIAGYSEPGVVVVEVRDRGPGIPEGEEERMFEKFRRGRSDGVRGAGLGLPICRAIVEAHRGSIRGLARSGGGAIIQVRLPDGQQGAQP